MILLVLRHSKTVACIIIDRYTLHRGCAPRMTIEHFPDRGMKLVYDIGMKLVCPKAEKNFCGKTHLFAKNTTYGHIGRLKNTTEIADSNTHTSISASA